jgi:hypothetical protein
MNNEHAVSVFIVPLVATASFAGERVGEVTAGKEVTKVGGLVAGMVGKEVGSAVAGMVGKEVGSAVAGMVGKEVVSAVAGMVGKEVGSTVAGVLGREVGCAVDGVTVGGGVGGLEGEFVEASGAAMEGTGLPENEAEEGLELLSQPSPTMTGPD